jgi:hypothetical protein
MRKKIERIQKEKTLLGVIHRMNQKKRISICMRNSQCMTGVYIPS